MLEQVQEVERGSCGMFVICSLFPPSETLTKHSQKTAYAPASFQQGGIQQGEEFMLLNASATFGYIRDTAVSMSHSLQFIYFFAEANELKKQMLRVRIAQQESVIFFLLK